MSNVSAAIGRLSCQLNRKRNFNNVVSYDGVEIVINPQSNAINLRLDLIHVGAAFQPRLSDYSYRATFISWLESRSHEELM